MKTGHWANTAAAILILGSVDPIQSEDNVALLKDRPVPAGIHETGLYTIHAPESDLDQVIVYVSNPELAIPPDTEENFIGKWSVRTKSSHKHILY